MTRGDGRTEPDRDPGLQPERTRLAWRRTTLSGTVSAVLAVKTALHGGPPRRTRRLRLVLCPLAWLLSLAHRRIRTLASIASPRALAPRHATAAVLCTAALAVFGTVLVL